MSEDEKGIDGEIQATYLELKNLVLHDYHEIIKRIEELEKKFEVMTDRVNHKIELEFCDNKYNQLIEQITFLKEVQIKYRTDYLETIKVLIEQTNELKETLRELLNRCWDFDTKDLIDKLDGNTGSARQTEETVIMTPKEINDMLEKEKPSHTGFHDVDEYYPPDECESHSYTCPKCFKTLIGTEKQDLKQIITILQYYIENYGTPSTKNLYERFNEKYLEERKPNAIGNMPGDKNE